MPLTKKKSSRPTEKVPKAEKTSGAEDDNSPAVKTEPQTGPFIKGGTILVKDKSGKIVDFNEDFCKSVTEGVHKRYCTVIFPGANGEPEVRRVIATVDPQKASISCDFESILNTSPKGSIGNENLVKENSNGNEVSPMCTSPNIDNAQIKEEPTADKTPLRRSSRKKAATDEEDVVFVRNDEEIVEVSDVEARRTPKKLKKVVNKRASVQYGNRTRQKQSLNVEKKTPRVVLGGRAKQPKNVIRARFKKNGRIDDSTVSKVQKKVQKPSQDVPTSIQDASMCPFCKVTLASKDFLLAHISKVHLTEKKDDKKTKFPRRERRYPCTQCEYVATCSSVLKLHCKGVHDKIRDFRCRLCARSFTYKAQLKRHMTLVHEKLRQHRCETCKKYFGTTTHLKMHLRAVHEKSKPVTCPTCGLKFLFPSGLKRHMDNTHIGTAVRFKCSKCKFITKYKANLKSHEQTVHPVGPKVKALHCSFCDFGTNRKYSLRLHLAKMHNIK